MTTTLTVYVHLFPEDDASEDMAALGAMGQLAPTHTANVIAPVQLLVGRISRPHIMAESPVALKLLVHQLVGREAIP